MITRASSILILAGILVVSVPQFAAGQDPTPSPTPEDAQRTWNNSGTDFNTDTNWTPNHAPGTGDVAAFNTAEVTQPKLSMSVTIAGLYFTGTGTSGYDLTNTAGETLTLTASNTAIGNETGNGNSVAIGAENTSGTNTIDVPIILAPGTGTVSTIFQATGGTLVINGVISGTGISLSKTGGGTLTLSGTNTYSGATTVSAGTLFVNGSLASGSAVTVSNSGTVLGGTGTINGSVSIASSGAILEGGTGSIGQTLTLKGAVTMSSGSVIELALGAAGTHSTLAISSPGTLTFATNQDFKFIGSPMVGTYTGIITGVPNPGTALNSWVIDNSGFTGTFSWDSTNGGEIDLTLTKVPEPGTWGAAALAALVIGYTQRRRVSRLLARA